MYISIEYPPNITYLSVQPVTASILDPSFGYRKTPFNSEKHINNKQKRVNNNIQTKQTFLLPSRVQIKIFKIYSLLKHQKQKR